MDQDKTDQPRALPQSVLFCCDHNAVRSPMAEGLMKKIYGTRAYVQSAGLRNDMEIDGFSIAVCAELGVELHRHRARSFVDMSEMGDELSSYDLIVALSAASHARITELTRVYHTHVEFWPIDDPTAKGETRDQKLAAYRVARDQILGRLTGYWGGSLETAQG